MVDINLNFETEFAVIGPERRRRFFPYLDNIPKPGQWIYIERQRLGIQRFLAQVTEVAIEQVKKDLFMVTVAVNRRSMKEDILFAKLARRTFDLIELEKELLEPLDFFESVDKSEAITVAVRTYVPSYSNANYSNAEVSGQ